VMLLVPSLSGVIVTQFVLSPWLKALVYCCCHQPFPAAEVFVPAATCQFTVSTTSVYCRP